MNSLLAIGAGGLHAAQSRLDQSAGRVARWGGSGVEAAAPDLATELVAQRQAAVDFSASLQVVRTADRLLGSLLDVQA